MTTALALVKRAMSEIGVLGAGDTLAAGDKETVFNALNDMVGMMNTSSLYSYATRDATVNLVPGTLAVTIGPGSAIDTPQPSGIEAGAFFRVGLTDYPVDVIERTRYDSIRQKSFTGGLPQALYYDRAGKLFLWPVAGMAGELHVPLRGRMSEFADLTTDYVLADGYQLMLSLSLAEEIADMFQRPVSANLAKRAAGARRSIKRQNVVVPTLEIDSRLTSCGGMHGMAIAVTEGGIGDGGGTGLPVFVLVDSNGNVLIDSGGNVLVDEGGNLILADGDNYLLD